MAFSPSYLRGLVSIEQLSLSTGFKIPTVRSYLSGLVAPRKSNLAKLEKVYTRTQISRLTNAGLPRGQAKILSDFGPRKINDLIKRTDSVIKKIAKGVNADRIEKGKSAIDESVFRESMQESDKTYEELFDSP